MKYPNYVDNLEQSVIVVRDKMFRYRIIYPIKNPDGSMNWFNFLTGGSWGNLLKVIGVVVFLCYLVYQYNSDMGTAVSCCESACRSLISSINTPTMYPNLSNITLR